MSTEDESKHDEVEEGGGKRRKALLVGGGAFAVLTLTVAALFGTHVLWFHQWSEATCTKPQKCSICGRTQGEPLGHEWRPATCTEPKTCDRCGLTSGKALGHEWKDATEELPATCSICGETNGSSIKETYEEAKEAFSEGNLDSARKLFSTIRDYKDSENHISLIDRTGEYDGIYSEKGDEHSWLALDGGGIKRYSNYYTSGGYDDTPTYEHVPQDEGGAIVRIDKYDFQGISSFSSTRYRLTEKDGTKVIMAEGGLYAGEEYYLTDEKASDFEDHIDNSPAKVEPEIGMTAQEVRDSTWGSPSEINTTKTKHGTHEQWVYSTKRYIYLDNGVVTAIQK